MLMLAAAGLAEMEPGDEFGLWVSGVVVMVFAIIFVVVIVLIANNAVASLESRQQRRFRASKSLFDIERETKNGSADPPR